VEYDQIVVMDDSKVTHFGDPTGVVQKSEVRPLFLFEGLENRLSGKYINTSEVADLFQDQIDSTYIPYSCYPCV
jgi:hypothetical protein